MSRDHYKRSQGRHSLNNAVAYDDSDPRVARLLSGSSMRRISLTMIPDNVEAPIPGMALDMSEMATEPPGRNQRRFPLRGSMVGSSERSIGSSVTIESHDDWNRAAESGKIFDDPFTVHAYAAVPMIDVDRLPRGGISFETKAVGRIQFGIPPETIKDSMKLGISVPTVYIAPSERFCREMGPALGINLCEFEFPAYFNYFVRSKQCILVVDSKEDEMNIRKVFSETLIGPAQFRNHSRPKANEDEDFDPSFAVEKRPNFYKEFYHFRTAEASTNYQEFTIDTLLQFCHFKTKAFKPNTKLGVPPLPPNAANGIGNISADLYHSDTTLKETPTISRKASNASLASLLEREKSELQLQGLRKTLSDPNLADTELLNEIRHSPFYRSSSEKISNKRRSFSKRGSDNGSQRSLKEHSKLGPNQVDMDEPHMGFWGSACSLMDSEDEEERKKTSWTYSQATWLGVMATVYPPGTKESDKETMAIPRVEIFKMPGGLEYIVHDIDENNHIIGKVRFSGTVHVSDSLAVHGYAFEHNDNEDEDGYHDNNGNSIPRRIAPPTFHPPSFGVTVLGNSHGFDKSGSTSGYVLWINGRGVMVDPPPYSSATLEREGIRPQMIMAIIVTHCHADHDAGTFQKVMTGSRVAVITTPTIYKSFIRKYAALSGLSPVLLRHSHRHRPAIIGRPLRFQGATFNFYYTLHTIPCIAFKVEWRKRSIVFTGDHLNSPPMIDRLEREGVLTKERADHLRFLPLRKCDVILHEAGAPPIHTPLAVLLDLPEEVRNRLYVVHTSALPADSPLRVAPTGTAGTIRLDHEYTPKSHPEVSNQRNLFSTAAKYLTKRNMLPQREQQQDLVSSLPNLNEDTSPFRGFFSERGRDQGRGRSPDRGVRPFLGRMWNSHRQIRQNITEKEAFDEKEALDEKSTDESPPLVMFRPTCVSDAWFILNLLSNVPFMSSLSYAATMEVLETSQVRIFCADEVVLPASQRSEVLCVVWEGTLIERESNDIPKIDKDTDDESCSTDFDERNNFDPAVWHAGDWTGPIALQPEVSLAGDCEANANTATNDIIAVSSQGVKVIMISVEDLHQILLSGSPLYRKYCNTEDKERCNDSESTSSSIYNDSPGRKMGQTSSLLDVISFNSHLMALSASQKRHLESLAEGPRYFEPGHFIWCVGVPVTFSFLIVSGTARFAHVGRRRPRTRRGSTGSMGLSYTGMTPEGMHNIQDKQLSHVPANSEYARLELSLQLRAEEIESGTYEHRMDLLPKEERLRNSRDRFANKVLGRLYARRAFTAGLVFSRGHFLSDTTRMVSGSLTYINDEKANVDDNSRQSDHHVHSSSLLAGPDGCVVFVFPRQSLITFLDANPGVLLSLLGTQVVV